MKELVLDLLKHQDELNTIINPDWKMERTEADFVRAMIVESGELLDHTGFKWWKHQKVDVGQAKIEIIDIWFFYFSMILLHTQDLDAFAVDVDVYSDGWCHESDAFFPFTSNNKLEWVTEDVQRTVISFVSEVSSMKLSLSPGEVRRFVLCNTRILGKLVDLTKAAGITFDEMYSLYMGKLILNIFRQENGYKEGTYKKQWENGSLEDNQVLERIMKNTNDPIEIRRELAHGYKKS